MNRAGLMLAALEEGEWLSRQDLFRHAGTFYLTNNAASELRALGHNVEQRRHEGKYQYCLNPAGQPCDRSSPGRAGLPTEAALPSVAESVPSLSCPAVLSEQLTLEAA